MSAKQTLYLLFALAGLIGTWSFIGQAYQAGELSWSGWAEAMWSSPLAASISADLLIAFACFLLFVVFEGRRLGMRHGWVFIVLGCTVAFAFAFPLFLFWRERVLARHRGE